MRTTRHSSMPLCLRRFVVGSYPGALLRVARFPNRVLAEFSGHCSAANTPFTISLGVPGRGSDNMARFNMPLELGMAMARRFMEPATEHDWLLGAERPHL